ncbi:MAG: nodulation efficiency protein D (NfeD) [Bacteroidales bacterium]|nr:nodulation efficiency protein D (NfeD) [Bacteroidales bacterium]
MEILTILILIGIAILLLLVEIFLIPGISVAGLGALACSLYAIYYAFVNLGTLGGLVTLIVTLIAGGLTFRAFMRSKTLDKLSLKKNIDSKIDKKEGLNIKVGDVGISTTRLALYGTALFNEKTIEVKSTEGFIDEKTPIEIVSITNDTILVKKQAK